MKTFFKVVTLAVVMASSSVVNAAQETQKIAVVFPSKIMQQSPQLAKIKKKLEAEFKVRIDELKKLKAEVNKLQQSLQRDAELMAASEVISLQREIEIKSFELKLKSEGLTNDNRRRQGEEQQKSWASIHDVIKSVATKNGYDVILSGEQILFANPELDISNLVIKEISKK